MQWPQHPVRIEETHTTNELLLRSPDHAHCCARNGSPELFTRFRDAFGNLKHDMKEEEEEKTTTTTTAERMDRIGYYPIRLDRD